MLVDRCTRVKHDWLVSAENKILSGQTAQRGGLAQQRMPFRLHLYPFLVCDDIQKSYWFALSQLKRRTLFVLLLKFLLAFIDVMNCRVFHFYLSLYKNTVI